MFSLNLKKKINISRYITHKKIKYLNRFRFNYYYNFKLKKTTVTKFKNSVSIKSLKKFFVIYRQFFRNLNSNVSYYKLSKNHKFIFKRSKKKFYFQNYFFYLESFISSVLYKSRIVPKLRQMKQLIFHRNLFVNEKCIKNYSYRYKYLDFVHLNFSYFFKNNTFTLDKSLKKPIFFFLKNSKMSMRYKKSLYLYKLKKFYFLSNKNFYLNNCILHYSLKNFFYTNTAKKLLFKFLSFFYYKAYNFLLNYKSNIPLIYLHLILKPIRLKYLSYINFFFLDFYGLKIISKQKLNKLNFFFYLIKNAKN